MTPDEYCQERTVSSGSSFYYSFLFLPKAQRQAITALYAFCREVDDVVDECREPAVARAKLDWWRLELSQLEAGSPQHPVTRALKPAREAFNLPVEYLLEIVDGMEMDLERNRYATFNDLALYCYRAAGAVGLLSAEIFGYKNRATLKYAENLGTAFQLTNILRDVAEDARRGRIYLPLDELARFDVSERDILERRASPGVSALCKFQAARAADYYDKAFALLPDEDRYAQRSGVIMAAIYRRVLDQLAARDTEHVFQPVRLSALRKIWIAWRTQRAEARRQRVRSPAGKPRSGKTS